jgi:hypothetical protein
LNEKNDYSFVCGHQQHFQQYASMKAVRQVEQGGLGAVMAANCGEESS